MDASCTFRDAVSDTGRPHEVAMARAAISSESTKYEDGWALDLMYCHASHGYTAGFATLTLLGPLRSSPPHAVRAVVVRGNAHSGLIAERRVHKAPISLEIARGPGVCCCIPRGRCFLHSGSGATTPSAPVHMRTVVVSRASMAAASDARGTREVSLRYMTRVRIAALRAAPIWEPERSKIAFMAAWDHAVPHDARRASAIGPSAR